MADPAPATLTVTTHLTPAQQDDVMALFERAATLDGHRAVNDAGLLALRSHPGESASDQPAGESGRHAPLHVLATVNSADGSAAGPTNHLLGYAQAVWESDGPVAALVVEPDRRRQGIGAALWQALAQQSPDPLRIWATGNTPAAQALAAFEGLRPVRTLLVLGRSLDGGLPPTEPPAGIVIRAFRPDRPGDLTGWLRVNSRAFATHPEQGSMTRADLEQRMAEPWFDPTGFFLAVRTVRTVRTDSSNSDEVDGEIVGFHWTKREPGATTGEVYVIGVDPTAGIRGLGTPLLGAGLRYLRDTGATTVDLYVEADNVRALALYRRYGFTPVTSDVMYATPAALSEGTG
ncbi:MAG: mycothiol synthase [Microlunatus sp.]